MNTLSTVPSFVFHNEIDTDYLQSLYGDDYEYIQEIYTTVLNDFDSLADNVDQCYSSGNTASLKSAVHKIKPVFGFVGLVSVQKECQGFEQLCGSKSVIEDLTVPVEILKTRIAEAKQIIAEEVKKLEIYNRNRA